LGRKNSVKIAEIHSMENVFETPERMEGDWYNSYFNNGNPLVLELGCGRGEYTVNMGRRFPEKNFVGIDIKGPRIWKGAGAALREGLMNVAFARFRIEYINEYFREPAASEMWIPFPDPFPRASKSGRRLTSPEFLARYKPILKPDAILHFKTDSTDLYQWTLDTYRERGIEILAFTDNLHNSEYLDEVTGIPTKYEGIFMAKGENIKYIRFKL
jgi:tRNA (guanine-N7-)-methyltransferase